MIDNYGYYGQWTIESTNMSTGEKTTIVRKNAITQGFFTAIHNFLSQNTSGILSNALNITHVGLGDNSTPAIRADELLYNEYSRVDITSKTFTDSLYTVTLFLDATEGNPTGGYIKELGIFTNATAIFNTGTLISRSVVNVQKTTNISLNLKWELRGK